MLRSSTIRSFDLINTVKTALKRCSISCVKCLDTKKLWGYRSRDKLRDNKGRFHIRNCVDCCDGNVIGVSHSIPEAENFKIFQDENTNVEERLEELKTLLEQKDKEQREWEESERKRQTVIRKTPTLRKLPTFVAVKVDEVKVVEVKVDEVKVDEAKVESVNDKADSVEMVEVEIDAKVDDDVDKDMNDSEMAWHRYYEKEYDMEYNLSVDVIVERIVSDIASDQDFVDNIEITKDALVEFLINQLFIIPGQCFRKEGNTYFVVTSEYRIDAENKPWYMCCCPSRETTTKRHFSVKIMQPKNKSAYAKCNENRQTYSRQLSACFPPSIKKD